MSDGKAGSIHTTMPMAFFGVGFINVRACTKRTTSKFVRNMCMDKDKHLFIECPFLRANYSQYLFQ